MKGLMRNVLGTFAAIGMMVVPANAEALTLVNDTSIEVNGTAYDPIVGMDGFDLSFTDGSSIGYQYSIDVENDPSATGNPNFTDLIMVSYSSTLGATPGAQSLVFSDLDIINGPGWIFDVNVIMNTLPATATISGFSNPGAPGTQSFSLDIGAFSSASMSGFIKLELTVVPEPSTYLMLGSMCALSAVAKRKKALRQA